MAEPEQEAPETEDAVSNAQVLEALHRLDKRLGALYSLMSMQSLGPDALMRFVHQDREIRFHVPDAVTDNIQRFMMEKRTFWEQRLLDRALPHLRECRTAADIGANIGNHAVFMGLIAGIPEVTCFEPQRYVFGLLQKNLAVNGLEHFKTINSAVGSRVGGADMVLHRNTSFHGTAYRESTDGEFPVTTLDESFPDGIDFIKIDVEGMQMEVLGGAVETLKAHKPTLWMELRRNHNEFEPVNKFLEDLGLGYTASPLGPDDCLFHAR
ncbi:MAG: FkbM family methyltransferase [Pseudomonadota bacterium]